MIRGVMILAGRLARFVVFGSSLCTCSTGCRPFTMAIAIQGDDTRAGKLLLWVSIYIVGDLFAGGDRNHIARGRSEVIVFDNSYMFRVLYKPSFKFPVERWDVVLLGQWSVACLVGVRTY